MLSGLAKPPHKEPNASPMRQALRQTVLRSAQVQQQIGRLSAQAPQQTALAGTSAKAQTLPQIQPAGQLRIPVALFATDLP